MDNLQMMRDIAANLKPGTPITLEMIKIEFAKRRFSYGQSNEKKGAA